MGRGVSAKVKTETVTKHSMSNGGSTLVEKVTETIVRPLRSDAILSQTTNIKRTINNKSMTFKKQADGTEVEEETTSLTQDEKESFMERWKQLWRPSATREDLIEAMLQHGRQKP